jgi:hypothetical protein
MFHFCLHVVRLFSHLKEFHAFTSVRLSRFNLRLSNHLTRNTHHKQHRIDSNQFDPINHDGEELLQPPTCGGDTIAVRGSSGSSSFIIVVTAINGSRGIFDLFTFINNATKANKSSSSPSSFTTYPTNIIINRH